VFEFKNPIADAVGKENNDRQAFREFGSGNDQAWVKQAIL